MSAKYTFWAWEVDINKAPLKLTLLQLANNANDDGVSWYSVPKMASRCGMSERALQGHIKTLEDMGLLVVKDRPGTSRIYELKYSEVLLRCGTPAESAPPPPQNLHHTPAESADDLNSDTNNRSKDYLSCQHDEAITAVIERINEITGQKLQPSAKVHRENISARLNDGFSLEDLISIVETKSAEWMGTKQQVYLVPKTLFRPSNFDRYLAESRLASKIPTAEQLVDVYHEKMPSMPHVGVITPKRRNLVTDFCLAGKMTVDKFSAYLDYIGTRCTWVMNPKYGYGFDFLVDRNTLDRARNTTLEDKIND